MDVGYRPDLSLYDCQVLKTGDYVRLGHMRNGQPVFSIGRGPHQPFWYGDDCYYADDAPFARMYRNGKLLIDHPPNTRQCGKPWVKDDVIYFEAHDENYPVPTGWYIYRANLDGSGVERLCPGANPVIYDNVLYTSVWDGVRFRIVKWPCV